MSSFSLTRNLRALIRLKYEIDDFTSFPVASSVIPAAVVASSPTSQSEYEPLLRLLRSHASSGNPKARTLRGTIADEIKSLPNPPIQVGVGKSFRKYVSLAESKSLVKLGRGDIEGQDWMELVVADVITSEVATISPFPLFSKSFELS